MNLEEVKSRFIDPYPSSHKRRNLFVLLEGFIQRLLIAEIPCEVWLDGSLLTEKPEPDDLDVTVILDADVGRCLKPEQDELIQSISDGKIADGIDSFAFVRIERGEIGYGDELADPAYSWGEQYGRETSEEWLKGFVVLKLRETNVGLRICR